MSEMKTIALTAFALGRNFALVQAQVQSRWDCNNNSLCGLGRWRSQGAARVGNPLLCWLPLGRNNEENQHRHYGSVQSLSTQWYYKLDTLISIALATLLPFVIL